MGKLASDGFDPQAFLSRVGAGKTILKFEKNQPIFKQGDVADAVFYLQKGSVKLTVLSGQAGKRSSGFWNRASSSARGALTAIHCASRPQPRWRPLWSPQ